MSPWSGARLGPARRARALGLRGASLLALAAGTIGALLSAGVQAGGVAFSGRIAAGCDELAACQSLEADAERRAAECLLFCGRAEAEHRAARLMRYRAEERRAVREHYRARERAEQVERDRIQAQARDERERRELLRAQEAAREQRERLELEQLRQASLDRRAADERQRRLGYYVALGADGRARRLTRCLDRHERCDVLAIDLLDAAPDEDERRALARLNEREPPPPGDGTSPEPPTAPADGIVHRAAPAPSLGATAPVPASAAGGEQTPRDSRPPAALDVTPAPLAAPHLPSS